MPVPNYIHHQDLSVLGSVQLGSTGRVAPSSLRRPEVTLYSLETSPMLGLPMQSEDLTDRTLGTDYITCGGTRRASLERKGLW